MRTVIALVFDRIALLASGGLFAGGLAWLLFHPLVVGLLQATMVGAILLGRRQMLRY